MYSGDVQLCWRSETTQSSGLLPLVEGAEVAMGMSFVESYGVWYHLCARSTIGNAAFERGCVATVVTCTPDVDALPAELIDEALNLLGGHESWSECMSQEV